MATLFPYAVLTFSVRRLLGCCSISKGHQCENVKFERQLRRTNDAFSEQIVEHGRVLVDYSQRHFFSSRQLIKNRRESVGQQLRRGDIRSIDRGLARQEKCCGWASWATHSALEPIHKVELLLLKRNTVKVAALLPWVGQ